MTFRLLTLCLVVGSGATMSAGSITVSSGGGTPYDVSALTGYATAGPMMDGMLVTACLKGGICTDATWATVGADAGAAFTADWSLSLTGDTYSANWTLANLTQTPLISLALNGIPGRTVFDIVSAPDLSPGSLAGWPATYSPGVNNFPDARAQYSNPLSINGALYGDLFLRLTIDFGDGFLGSVDFLADTDNAGVDVQAVPEPGTYALIGVGLLVLAAIRVRRRNG